MRVYSKILTLASRFDKLAVVDLSEFKKKKQKEQSDKKAVLWLFEQMDRKTIGDAFGSGGLTVDDMHQARKTIGFPPVDKEAPSWVHATIEIIDEKDPKKRKAEYERFMLSIERLSNREEADKEKKEKTKEQTQRFIEDAKRGWIRFVEFNSWKHNYSLLFGQFGFGEDRFLSSLRENAIKQIKNKNEYEAGRTKIRSAIPKGTNPSQLPNGTTLYSAEKYLQKYHGEWVRKLGNEDWGNWLVHWPDGRETDANDVFVAKALSTGQELYPNLITVPLNYIEKIKNRKPTEKQIHNVIQYTIEHDPKRFLYSQIVYHTPVYISDEQENQEDVY